MSRIIRSTFSPAMQSLLLLFVSTASFGAEVHRCQNEAGQLVFQDHPCDSGNAAITAPAPTTSVAEQQSARQECEQWSQLGYLAAVARDAKQPQQHVLERYGRDGLDDGERAAIDWAYRESSTAPTEIKRAIRQDCLRERLQESNSVRFGYDPEKRPGDFLIGSAKFHLASLTPWVLDHTQSGKTHANLQLFATGGDPGRMYGLCRLEQEPLDQQKAEATLRASALTSEADPASLHQPVVSHQPHADGLFSYISLPLRPAPDRSAAELKLPRHITHGLYSKGSLHCQYRVETYLPDGPARRAALDTMRSVYPRP
ncbi:MAG: DUF4124 domain-containing protein [Pseudomonadota bacterium]